jgi:hypothetical protein
MSRVWIGLVVLSLAAVSACGGSDAPSEAQLIDERAAEVMPFDLDKTTHTFDMSATGGVQTVVAIDPGDTQQIALIQSHLLDEAEMFRQGDYTDPAEIHGMDMPGLEELRDGYREITVEYVELEDGAQIVYTTSDDTLVNAVHAWFERQTMDHS